METIALTEETFEETVTRPGITLVDWWASWCGPCRMFAPVFQAVRDLDMDEVRGQVARQQAEGATR
jgi:thioredoxin 1